MRRRVGPSRPPGLPADQAVSGVVSFLSRGQLPEPDLAKVPALGANLKLYAYQLFTTYLLPVQILGFLLLIAMLGVTVLSKKFEELADIQRRAG